MLIPTVIMAVLAVALLVVGYSNGEGQHIQGLRSGLKNMVKTLIV